MIKNKTLPRNSIKKDRCSTAILKCKHDNALSGSLFHLGLPKQKEIPNKNSQHHLKHRKNKKALRTAETRLKKKETLGTQAHGPFTFVSFAFCELLAFKACMPSSCDCVSSSSAFPEPSQAVPENPELPPVCIHVSLGDDVTGRSSEYLYGC